MSRKKKKYITAYDKNNYQKDEKSFNESMTNNKPVDWSAFRRLLISDICANTNIIDTGCIGEIKLKDVESALKHPNHGWKILVQISEQLMRISPHYYRLNNLYSNMALFCWGIDLYDVKENARLATRRKEFFSA